MRSIISTFGKNTRGSVAVVFAVSAFVLLGAVGAAFDYSRAAMTQTYLQRAADGVALLAAGNRDQFSGYTIDDTAATSYFRNTFNADRAKDLHVKMTFLDDRVQVAASAAVPTTIANVLGFATIPIAASSEALYDSKLEIALVLDNTGSMAQANKMTMLKAGAQNFLTLMQKSPGKPDGVKIGVVPFDTDVNLGGLSSSAWVDKSQIGSWTTKPSTAGCVWDREQPYDVDDTVPAPATNKLYSADPTREQPCNIGPILPLTTDFTALRASIEGMNPSGNTNVTIGLAWGFHVLTPSEPITNAAALYARGTTKYLILMTDGDNTQNRFSKDNDTINARTSLACENLRNAGIKVFTTGIMVSAKATSLLRACASNPGMAYEITDVSQFDAVFQSIYNAIMQTRLSK
jgi:Flp pilus assembly protein TadG